MPPTLADIRRHAVSRSLFVAPTLRTALARFGFVQADPIRSPARAQDLTLRHRVAGYRAGDLERRYTSLGIEEDAFINYGFLPRELASLMHPRTPHTEWSKARRTQAQAVLAFIRERGVVHPRDVDQAFDHGRTRNWFGGNSRASTQLLDGMHYRGLVRIAAREGGVRLYAVRDLNEAAHPHNSDAVLDSLADVLVNLYAPLTARGLSAMLRRLRYGTPQWAGQLGALVTRTKARLPNVCVEGEQWFSPHGESPGHRRHAAVDEDTTLRLLAPFDPMVWDRARFELLWGWPYRFEAYTPAAKRVRGYYAMPMLWRGQVIGWANASVAEGRLLVAPGFVRGKPPRDKSFKLAWQEETERLRDFLGVVTSTF